MGADLPVVSQLEIPIQRSTEKDRNYHLGGRSFYFFDFDDNVAFLGTGLVLFHKKTGAEKVISSGEFAKQTHFIGKSGPYQDYEIRLDEKIGTFRNFRDHELTELEKLGFKDQSFVRDVSLAIQQPDYLWKGPSWSCFYHATFNQRPVSVITARGHHPDTLRDGINSFVKDKHLPHSPHFLSLFPVNNLEVRKALGDSALLKGTAELKQAAIRASVEMAIKTYGYSPHHRFGMSDDDPRNVELITEEMSRLKDQYREMKFFIIETQDGQFTKTEIGVSGPASHKIPTGIQLAFKVDER